MELVFVGLFSLAVGSFLNVVICRVPKMAYIKSGAVTYEGHYGLSTPRSRCPSCDSALKWYQNIPLFSYIALKGRCANCNHLIGIQYPLVEAAAALLGLLAFFLADYEPLLSIWIAMLFWMSLCLCLISAKHAFASNAIVYPLLALGLLGSGLDIIHVSPLDSLAGAVFGYLMPAIMVAIFKLARKSDNADLTPLMLLSAFGAWVGFSSIINVALVVALTVLAIMVTINLVRIIQGYSPFTQSPFGPALCLAGVIIFVGLEAGFIHVA